MESGGQSFNPRYHYCRAPRANLAVNDTFAGRQDQLQSTEAAMYELSSTIEAISGGDSSPIFVYLS